ncbi:MAG: exodeoxyribonuclease III [Candidatus Handelsmanbacteria bacterium]|nr:exodeoxyribonuclease III [Candidatus Handelsmanbacteria bacterium]
MAVKLLCWNVNGIRSAATKGFLSWLAKARPLVLCIQEARARPEQVDPELVAPRGYRSWWACAEKKGYSGVVIYSRVEPLDVTQGLGIPRFDGEGRLLAARFADFTIVNTYFPNGQRDHARVPYKMEFCEAFMEFCAARRARGERLILCGDFNTAHREIDLARPRENQNTTGFLPLERAWMDRFIAAGYADIFRALNPAPGHYTWWSNRSGARERNIGWRIDYHFISPELRGRVKRAYHLPQVLGSDHCPIGIDLHK